MEKNFKLEKKISMQKEDYDDELDKVANILKDRINILRKENNYTQVRFFEEINYIKMSSNASKILNNPKKIVKDVILLKKIATRFNVSINWLIGNLPLEIRSDSMKDINAEIGLSEANIAKLHRILEYNIIEDEERKRYKLPIYESYKDTINKLISSTYFLSILDNFRMIEINNRNISDTDFGHSITYDKKVILSPKMAKEFLIQDAQNNLRKLIEEKYS